MEKFFKCGDRLLELNKTLIMGILNITPDSFFDGGEYFDKGSALLHAEKMMSDGADIIDIGAQSTRPGSRPIDSNEEWQRLDRILPELINSFPGAVFSLDTFYPEIAERACSMGVHIINDISGCADKRMLAVAKKYNAGIIVMHPGNPDDIVGIKGSIVDEVEGFFADKKRRALSLGLDERQLCFDPGIGFGKSPEQNIELIMATKRLSGMGQAYLMGLSRKRVTAVDNAPIRSRLSSTISLNTIAQLYGANILRVHDVYESRIAAIAADTAIRRDRLSNGE